MIKMLILFLSISTFSNEILDTKDLARSCENKNNLDSCLKLSKHFQSIKNIQLLKKYTRISCDLSSAKSCNDLAFLYIKDRKINKALLLFYKACKNDYGKACFNIGNIFKHKKDNTKAKKYYKRGCDDVLIPYGESCLRYSDSLEIHEIKRKDIYLKKSCRAGLKKSCK